MEKLTAITAKAILKKLNKKVMCRTLSDQKMKKDHLQCFIDVWCGTAMSYYIFNLEDKSVREGNFYNIEGKQKFLYYKEPAIN